MKPLAHHHAKQKSGNGRNCLGLQLDEWLGLEGEGPA